MPVRFSNNASAPLAAGISDSITSITVAPGQGVKFPALVTGDYFFATLVSPTNDLEIIKVTAKSGDTLTAVRGQDGTIARSFSVGDRLELRPVAAALNSLNEFVPSGNIAAATVQAAIAELDLEKAPLVSPALTGNPTAPTQVLSSNNTSIATTEFVKLAVAEGSENLIPAGTKMLFQQTSAPPGWLKSAAHNNKALRVVSGTAGSGGSVGFSTAFNVARTVTGEVAGHALSVAQMPLHGHPWSGGGGGDANIRGGPFTSRADSWGVYSAYTGTPTSVAGQTIGGTGGGQTHAHNWSGAVNLEVQYVDVIIAEKE
jgi:hypothetical protein